MKSVAIIGGNIKILQRARDLGLHVLLLHDFRNEAFTPRCAELCDDVIDVDFVNDYDAVERVILARHEERPFAGVFSLDEDALVAVARLNQLLSLGGNSLPAVWRLKDKVQMRDSLRGSDLSPVEYRHVRDGQDLEGFLRSIERTTVLKPIRGCGSEDVFIVNDVRDVERVWQEARARGYTEMLAEEFLEGPEFSVDTFSADGRHVVLAITRKLMRGSLEIGHSMPSILDAGLADRCSSMVSRFLDLMGVAHGPAHTEIRITADGPRIIESQNRIGGGRLHELMELALGIDVTRMALTVPLGIEPLPEKIDPVGGAAVRYFLPEPGKVLEVSGLANLPKDDKLQVRISVKPGDDVFEQHTSHDRNALGCFVISGGKDETDAVRRAEHILRSIQITTTPEADGGENVPTSSMLEA
ncbi:ATP-grasp domain-containing protein [Streptosporangium sandarakinum]|uniref:ATP-grasp domain-containing protein n=1 Tax=Streptosporangium sandarakinum TaxID=1260955 RepID=UPI00343A9B33